MTDLSSRILEISDALKFCAEFSGNISFPPKICYELVKDVDENWSSHFEPFQAQNLKYSENCQRHYFHVDVKVTFSIFRQIPKKKSLTLKKILTLRKIDQ